MDTVLSLILLVSEILIIPKTEFEANFFKKLAFVTNKCLPQDAFDNRRQQKTFENT